MPRKKKTKTPSEAQPAAEPKIPKESLDQLITGPMPQGEFETIYRALLTGVERGDDRAPGLQAW